MLVCSPITSLSDYFDKELTHFSLVAFLKQRLCILEVLLYVVFVFYLFRMNFLSWTKYADTRYSNLFRIRRCAF